MAMLKIKGFIVLVRTRQYGVISRLSASPRKGQKESPA
jgi:hypothetical protein